MTQNALVLQYLKSGKPVTALFALDRWRIMRLAARIADLRRAGHEISTTLVTFGKKRYAQYWMA